MNDRHRCLFLLCGDPEWCRRTACSRLEHHGYRNILWIGTEPPTRGRAIPATKVATRLGNETDALVFDAWCGFDPDAFGAALGGVRGGGVILLLTPPLEAWETIPDAAMERFTPWPHHPGERDSPFLRRLAEIVSTSSHLRLFRPGDPPPALPPPPKPRTSEGIRLTADQCRAVEAIRRVARGHRRRPLVLTAHRGRGKSAALGIAAAQLLETGMERILVTAPRRDATRALFRHAGEWLPDAEVSPGLIRWRKGWIRFLPPDPLCRGEEPADLLLVDEAAAIPVPLLSTLLERYARIVFATTVHGYEGTGRGFDIRFREQLQRRTPGWRNLWLSRPVRWAENDPVERFGFRALLLDASPAPDETMARATPERCRWKRLSHDQLLADESLLHELFGLLVQAHYRTRPSDLRNLLDGPGISVHLLLHEGHVAATALVVEEGGLDEKLADAVWLGQRRVRGHLLPQSLAAHAGFAEAARLRYARIMRLAVHPAVRRRGLGSRLVTEMVRHYGRHEVDAVGTSFGATPDLLRFWHRAGFTSVHMGLRAEASSGHHAAFLLHPLSRTGEGVGRRLQRHLRELLPTLLRGPLRYLEPETAAELLANLPALPLRLDEQERRDLFAFAFGYRGYEMCAHTIGKAAFATLAGGKGAVALSPEERNLLIVRVLQDREWAETARHFTLPGKRAALAALRRAVTKLAERFPARLHHIGVPPPALPHGR